MYVETRVPLKEVMRVNPTTIEAEATVAKAAAMMCRDEVGSCIVLSGNVPIGIVTEQDMNCKVVAQDLRPSEVRVKDIMSTPLITIDADMTVGEAAHMMISHRVRRLPVVDNGKVTGIVTVRDLLGVANELNEIMSDLIVINREESYTMGVCDRCGKMSDELVSLDSIMLCKECREEEHLR
ncbi:CBS domain-containing protein [Methanofollis fontis]|uniref:CBS domain-containing protein n=2 Tax=Methanofollis fontis TaxID=2052832 RepID=A0A483CWS7_9EURY|nr:CBS domain-containing protein [Methanofollis fontis]